MRVLFLGGCKKRAMMQGGKTQWAQVSYCEAKFNDEARRIPRKSWSSNKVVAKWIFYFMMMRG